MSKRTAAKPQQLSNLYRFVRLVLGRNVSDSAIAKKWKMDGKNFSDFKHAKYPMVRINRLVTLAQLLGVDDHLVYEVAKGNPAERMYRIITTESGRAKLIKTITVRYSTGKLIRPSKLLKV
jgi:hypothetical protein